MKLTELVELKEGLFERPANVTEIRDGKSITKVKNFYDIVDALASRNKGEVLELEGFDIIPGNFRSPQNFRKRGQVVVLNTYRGNERELKGNRLTELKARIIAEESGRFRRENGPYIGWSWVDPEQITHIVRPTVGIQGYQLQEYARRAGNIREQIKIYSAKDGASNTVSVQVPSRSSSKPHQVVLEHVAKLNGDDKFVEWTRFSSRHDCDLKRNDFTFRFNGKIVTYCPHDAAAHYAYSRLAAEITGEIIPQIFPLFTESTYRAFRGATHSVVKIDEYSEEGKKRRRARMLTIPEIDAVLMDAWLLHGNRQTFFVRSPKGDYGTGRPVGERKRMRDYAWFESDMSGIPFGND